MCIKLITTHLNILTPWTETCLHSYEERYGVNHDALILLLLSKIENKHYLHNSVGLLKSQVYLQKYLYCLTASSSYQWIGAWSFSFSAELNHLNNHSWLPTYLALLYNPIFLEEFIFANFTNPCKIREIKSSPKKWQWITCLLWKHRSREITDVIILKICGIWKILDWIQIQANT